MMKGKRKKEGKRGEKKRGKGGKRRKKRDNGEKGKKINKEKNYEIILYLRGGGGIHISPQSVQYLLISLQKYLFRKRGWGLYDLGENIYTPD